MQQAVGGGRIAQSRALCGVKLRILRGGFRAHQIARFLDMFAAVHEDVDQLVHEHEGKIARVARNPYRIGQLRTRFAVSAADRLGVESRALEGFGNEVYGRSPERKASRQFARARSGVVMEARVALEAVKLQRRNEDPSLAENSGCSARGVNQYLR
jgi:hypothetical protein